jgi:DtxR family Mn-dependent transcriptional regulator
MKTFSFHHISENETQDHILEFLYDKIEKKKAGNVESLIKLFKTEVKDSLNTLLVQMSSENLIAIEKDSISLTLKGFKKAELLVKGHRLAQRLMVDILGISPENANKTAHYMEHIVDEEVLNALSAFLGYPDTSPDGKPIPNPGGKKIFTLKPVISKLSDLEIGTEGKIKYIQSPQDILSQMGLMPGEIIKLIQKKPSVILEIGHTTIAIDSSLAKTIFVHPR